MRSEDMKEAAQPIRLEPRWPAALAIISVLVLFVLLPNGIRILPVWVTHLLGIVVLVPMVVVRLTSARPRWLGIERTATLLFCVVVVVLVLANLGNLIHEMLDKSAEILGEELLASSVGVWAANVLAFSLLYWQIDRASPEARANDE